MVKGRAELKAGGRGRRRMPEGALVCAFLMELTNLEEAFAPIVSAHGRPFEQSGYLHITVLQSRGEAILLQPVPGMRA